MVNRCRCLVKRARDNFLSGKALVGSGRPSYKAMRQEWERSVCEEGHRPVQGHGGGVWRGKQRISPDELSSLEPQAITISLAYFFLPRHIRTMHSCQVILSGTQRPPFTARHNSH